MVSERSSSYSRRKLIKRLGAASVVAGLAGCLGGDGGDGGGGGGGADGGGDGGADGDGGDGGDGGGADGGGDGAADGGDGGGDGGATTMQEPLQVAGLLPSPTDDFGWSQSEYNAMQRAADNVDGVELNNVVAPVTYNDLQSVINDLLGENDILIPDSNGYLESGALELSKRNSDTYFMTRNTAIPPDDLPENHVTWNNHHGMVWAAMAYPAGLMTTMDEFVEDTPRVGLVDSIPVLVRQHAVRGSFCALHESNPDAELMINWINSWFAPDKTRRNAETHVENGADILLNGTNGAIPGNVAEGNGKWAVGYGIDMSQAAPDGYATSILMNAAPIFEDGFRAARDGEWDAFWNRDPNHHLWTPKYWQGEPVIEVGPWHDDIPQEVRTKTEDYVESLINWEIKIPEVWRENVCPSGHEFEYEFPS